MVLVVPRSSRDGRLHDRPSLRTGLAYHASGSLDVISEPNSASCGSKTGGIRLGRLCRYHSVVNETRCSVNQSIRYPRCIAVTPDGGTGCLGLNCQTHDVPILVAARLLKPLGNPAPNCTKCFATAELL